MIAVVDTSALVRLTTLRAVDIGGALSKALAEATPYAPDVVDAEFHHALRGLLLGDKISAARADLARTVFGDVPLTRMPTRALVDRIWSLRHNLGAYDACFIALAETLDAPLITCDTKHATAAGHRAEIRLFSSMD